MGAHESPPPLVAGAGGDVGWEIDWRNPAVAEKGERKASSAMM